MLRLVAEAVINADKAGIPKVSVTQTTVTGWFNAIFALAGVVCVVFIVLGGLNYITSDGDSGKTTSAKNTILYAIIGLVVMILAFGIVNFVVGTFK